MVKLIILAAGKGSRLMPLTQKIPKPLIVVEKGKTILDMALDEIIKSKVVDEVIYVVGYLAEQIEAKLKTINKIKTRTIYNPFYEESCDLYSLWFAIKEIDSDVFITNADNIINAKVYKMMQKEKGIVLAVSKSDNLLPDETKVQIDGDEIINASKKINGDCLVESVSLLRITKEKAVLFKEVLDKMVREGNYIDEHWLDIFYRLYKEGIQVKPLEVPRGLWDEVDYHGDLVDVMKKYKKMRGKKHG